MFGAWLLGAPFSFTGHAADLFRDRVALEDKIRRADFIVCISEFHRDFFLKLGARPEQLKIVYCGIDITHFTAREGAGAARSGGPVHLVSSGRLVEKKGFLVLVEACALLVSRGVDFRCTIGGNGPQEQEIRELIKARGLGDRIVVTGKPLTQEELPAFMNAGDIYALPCVWAGDGDVDGLPQMLMEAMACGLPRGFDPRDPRSHRRRPLGPARRDGRCPSVGRRPRRLIKDPELSRRIADEGARVVREKFEIDTALQPVIRLFKERLARAGAAPSGERRGT